MKVTKIVTKAVLYDGVKGEPFTRVFVGRLTRRKVENITGLVCISLEYIKAIISLPDTFVEQYATIEPMNNEVKPAELV